MHAILQMHEGDVDDVYIATSDAAAVHYLQEQLSTDRLLEQEWLEEVGAGTPEEISEKYYAARASGLQSEVNFQCDEGHGYSVRFDVQAIGAMEMH